MRGEGSSLHQEERRKTGAMCEHFGICGGCKWQNLPYEEQIKAKQKQVEDQLTRIGKIELPEFRPIMQREDPGVP